MSFLAARFVSAYHVPAVIVVVAESVAVTVVAVAIVVAVVVAVAIVAISGSSEELWSRSRGHTSGCSHGVEPFPIGFIYRLVGGQGLS